MQAYIISDLDYQTEIFHRLDDLVSSNLRDRGFQIDHRAIGRKDLNYCKGCFGCWIKEPGECGIKDGIGEINHNSMNSDVVVYISPVIFGQFSANIKNAIDRWLPNMLPFFTSRPDGSTMHPPRYPTYPKQIIIGYGNDISQNDAQLFIDITQKHRTNIEVVVFQEDESVIQDVLAKNKLERVGGQL